MHYLVLYLQGALQAWGAASRFDLRETMPFPTKSGIYGLLLAASGDSGPQNELLAEMAGAPLTVFTFKGGGSRKLLDYQPIGNGYDGGDKWQNQMVPKKSDGNTVKSNGGGGGSKKQTYRYYLQEKTFAAILGLPETLAGKFASALQSPVYDLYLGRKCCPPSAMIFQGCFDSEEAALKQVRNLARQNGLEPASRIREVPGRTENAMLINDVPVQFGDHHIYRDRWILAEE